MTDTLRKTFDVHAYYKMVEMGIIQEQERVELIHGEIINMSPINSRHAGIINKLNELLVRRLHGKAIVSIQNPLRLDEYNQPEPDVVVSTFRENHYMDQHPGKDDVLLIIEVADTSLGYDREVKAALYASAGIPEYWIINLKVNMIEVYRNPRHNYYTSKHLYEKGDIISTQAIAFELEVDQLF